MDVELFYKCVACAIMNDWAEYLKKAKRVPVPQELPKVEDFPSDKVWAKMRFWKRLQFKRRRKKQIKAYEQAKRRVPVTMDDKLLKGYNAGIEAALKMLDGEFRVYVKRQEAEERGRKTF